MLKFLFGIILFFGFILMLAGVLGLKILRELFGFGRKSQHQSRQTTSNSASRSKRSKKIFGKHEGEYVDFEEIVEEDEKNDE